MIEILKGSWGVEPAQAKVNSSDGEIESPILGTDFYFRWLQRENRTPKS